MHSTPAYGEAGLLFGFRQTTASAIPTAEAEADDIIHAGRGSVNGGGDGDGRGWHTEISLLNGPAVCQWDSNKTTALRGTRCFTLLENQRGHVHDDHCSDPQERDEPARGTMDLTCQDLVIGGALPFTLEKEQGNGNRQRQRDEHLLQDHETVCGFFQKTWGTPKGQVGLIIRKKERSVLTNAPDSCTLAS